jgi:hypothetical protein
VYVTNSLYSPWDAQFYPDGIDGWMAKLDVEPEGDAPFDREFLVEFEMACARTRCGCRAETRRPTPSATQE